MKYINEKMIVAAITSQMVTNIDDERELHRLARSSDKEERQKAYDSINTKLKDLGDAIHFSRISDISKGYMPDDSTIVSKSYDTLYDPRKIRAYTFDLLATMLNIDAKWLQFFQMVPAYGAGVVETATITNLVSHKEYADGAKIEAVPLAGLSDTQLRERRFGGASNWLNRWLTTNNMMTISSILTRHQVAELKKKASVAYTALADTTGVTVQAFTTSLITTINEGVNSLVTALLTASGGEYDITDDSQFLLLSNSANKEAINAAFRTIQGENGNNPLLEYNVQPVFTRNTAVARDLGLGGSNRAMLILPGVANIWADFQSAKVGQEEDVASDSTKVVYQYYFNLQVVAIQKRVITLS